MIEVKDLRKIFKLILISGYLKKTKPLSLMLVADKGLGKTDLITSIDSKRILYRTDLTYMGLLNDIVKNQKAKHVILPDFLKITMKRKATGDNLISLLNALVEEGLAVISLFNFNQDFKGRNLGLILATTKSSYDQQKRKWESIGFLSRFLIISYSYKKETLDKIFDYVNGDTYKKIIESLKGYTDKTITSTKTLNSQLNELANLDIRRLKQLQTLAKCNCLLNHRNKVEQQDIDEILRLSKYMNLNYSQI